MSGPSLADQVVPGDPQEPGDAGHPALPGQAALVPVVQRHPRDEPDEEKSGKQHGLHRRDSNQSPRLRPLQIQEPTFPLKKNKVFLLMFILAKLDLEFHEPEL